MNVILLLKYLESLLFINVLMPWFPWSFTKQASVPETVTKLCNETGCFVRTFIKNEEFCFPLFELFKASRVQIMQALPTSDTRISVSIDYPTLTNSPIGRLFLLIVLFPLPSFISLFLYSSGICSWRNTLICTGVIAPHTSKPSRKPAWSIRVSGRSMG